MPWIVLLSLLFSPAPAYAGALAEVFGTGGPGAPIVYLLLIAGFGTICNYIISALGYGQIASMVRLITVFGCISTVVGAIWKAISLVASVFKVQL